MVFFTPLFSQFTVVQPGERLAITLNATDQVNNTREAVWALDAPNQETVSLVSIYLLCSQIYMYGHQEFGF